MLRRTLLLLAGIFGGVLLWLQQGSVLSQQSPRAEEEALSVRVRFGVNESSPRAWHGSVSATAGRIVSLRNWQPRPGDEVSGTSWKLATRQGPNFVTRPWEQERLTDPVPYLAVPGIVVDVTPAARLRFTTANGNFDVDVAQVQPGKPFTALGGVVIVDRMPPAQALSGKEYQDDFAAMLSGNGEVWAAWVGYRDNANDVLLRRFDGKTWSPVQKATEKPGDIFLVKLGRDRNGHVWAVWSAQVNGNFDLYARRWDGRAWSGTDRLTTAPQPDIYHALATDSTGTMWLAWQGFRDGKADVFARRFDGKSWSPEERISLSPANDWEPALATDGKGSVFAAWDTYDKGNYDVMMRRFANGAWSDVQSVASTPKFEAHVSLACDRDGRLWAAWNESGFEWGKDAGFLVRKEATRLYQWRSIGVAVHDGAEWREPVADLNAALPFELREYNDFPLVQADPSGRMWLFFRHRTLRIRDTHNNTPAHRAAWEIFATAYEGGRWSEPVAVPFSQSRQDVRAGVASDGRNLWLAWPTDNRDFEAFLFQHADVYAAPLPLPAGAPQPASLRSRHIPKLTAFVAHADEPGDLQRIRAYTIQSGGKTYRIYRGDTHRHTEFSMDGNVDGSLQQTYRYAMDAASLDFLMVSDHNGAAGPDVEYVNYLMQQMADVLMLPRTFAPLYGYERSLPYPNGHRNVIFAKRGNPTLLIPPEEMKAKVGAQSLYAYLKRFGGICISHTSASNMGTDWRDNDPEVEPLVEIYQGDRVSAEYEGAPKAAHRGNPASAPGGFRPAGYVWNAWAKGYKLGVQVSSDHLSTHISYACTLATAFTREGLLDAMKQRHSYGATDNIILDYRMETGGREYLQGDIVPSAGEVKLSIKIIGTTPIRQIDIIRNNTFIHNRNPLEKEVSFTYVDNQPLPGESYYYVRVIQADDNMAWSSPIWIKR
jgi:hypothetical protein